MMRRNAFPSTRIATILLFAAITILRAGNPARGGTIVGDAADFEPRLRTGGTITPEGPYDPCPSVNATSLRIGFQTNFLITSAFFFRLPLLAPGETITAADFSITELPDSA